MNSLPDNKQSIPDQEKVLGKKIASGNYRIFDSLADPYCEIVLRAIESCLASQRDISEILNGTTDRAYKNFQQYSLDQRFLHWLIKLAVQEATRSETKYGCVNNAKKDQGGNFTDELTSADLGSVQEIRRQHLYELEKLRYTSCR